MIESDSWGTRCWFLLPELMRLSDFDRSRLDFDQRLERLYAAKRVHVSSKVYFLKESGVGAIKIGTSTNVDARMRAISSCTAHTLVLLATIDGGYEVESLVLELFRHARIRSEWFRPVPELLAYITEIRDSTPCDFELFLERYCCPLLWRRRKSG